MYPWGSGSLTGSYTPIKNAYTSTASAGFSGAPITRLLTDFDRHSAVYTDTVNQTVTMFDGSIGLKLRIRPREKKVAFDIGAAGMGLLMKNTPRPPLYTISDGFAPGNGTFSHQSADITARALMFTLAISR